MQEKLRSFFRGFLILKTHLKDNGWKAVLTMQANIS